MPITYEAVVDGIRVGVSRAKGVALAPEDITDSTPLWSADELGQPCLALDSLDVLELIVFLEDEYGWDLPESSIDAYDCKSVGDLATMVIEHMRGKP
ncbi:acyl carrier protein [Phytohabitans suffuscus]|uniref:acyl carrier protein n=1 Tax=Phytohabitans suffuscus TaxID=624315 RepID=UPI001565F16D|nr:acyl carrier protein [Phytohabitans suffuscus]